jgi:hypothetical protein
MFSATMAIVISTGCGGHAHEHGLNDFRPIAKVAYAEKKWRDPSPVHSWKAMRHMKKCAYSRKARRNMERFRFKQKRQHFRFYMNLIDPPGKDWLNALGACEADSSGGYEANTGNGFYGRYQFDLQTWYSVGGNGYPDDALPREQDYRAALLYQSRGSSPWPVCG